MAVTIIIIAIITINPPFLFWVGASWVAEGRRIDFYERQWVERERRLELLSEGFRAEQDPLYYSI